MPGIKKKKNFLVHFFEKFIVIQKEKKVLIIKFTAFISGLTHSKYKFK
jgi:hypothetical protein